MPCHTDFLYSLSNQSKERAKTRWKLIDVTTIFLFTLAKVNEKRAMKEYLMNKHTFHLCVCVYKSKMKGEKYIKNRHQNVDTAENCTRSQQQRYENPS